MSMSYGCPFCLGSLPSWTEESKRYSNFCLDCAVEYRVSAEGKFQWLRYHLTDNNKHFVYLTIDFERNYTALGDALNCKVILTLPYTFPLMPTTEAKKLVERLQNLKAFL